VCCVLLNRLSDSARHGMIVSHTWQTSKSIGAKRGTSCHSFCAVLFGIIMDFVTAVLSAWMRDSCQRRLRVCLDWIATT
jgi:hypothetical protein